jgi:hypothetical protein
MVGWMKRRGVLGWMKRRGVLMGSEKIGRFRWVGRERGLVGEALQFKRRCIVALRGPPA